MVVISCAWVTEIYVPIEHCVVRMSGQVTVLNSTATTDCGQVQLQTAKFYCMKPALAEPGWGKTCQGLTPPAETYIWKLFGGCSHNVVFGG